ncbi:C2H2-like zinc finger protein [Hirschfeldia incana]|nr:C2H2-like zinc finger protein [Hirschfeldia incana]
MQKHKCKLCSKSFCNGRALGGHMKSHLVSVSSHTPTRKKLSDSFHSSSSSSEGKTLVYGLRENPRKSFRVFSSKDPESSSIVYNSDTETEPESVAPVRKRNRTAVSKNKKKKKKSKKMMMSRISSPEQVSYVSDGSQDHDLAMCLMMLSRDSRETELKKPVLAAEDTKLEKRQFPELRRCVIDLNLPPPQENDVVTVVSAV